MKDQGITANTALRLERYFGVSAQFWMNLQTHYDLEIESDRLDERAMSEILPLINQGKTLAAIG